MNKKSNKRYELDENEKVTSQSLWDAAIAVLRENVYTNANNQKRKRSQITDVRLHSKKLKKSKLNPKQAEERT